MIDKCRDCNVTDNEYHRLNECTRQGYLNQANNPVKIVFNDIYSSNADVLNKIIKEIDNVWEFRYANGRMKRLMS